MDDLKEQRARIIQTIHRRGDLDQLRKELGYTAFINRLQELLGNEWQAQAIPLEQYELRHDAHVLRNLVEGFGVLAEFIPPARTDLSDLAFNSDGKLWIRRKDAAMFHQVEGKWKLEEIMHAINSGLLMEQTKAITEADVSVDAKIGGPVLDADGNLIGRRPMARIKVHHPIVTAGMEYPSLVLRFYETQQVTPQRVLDWNMVPEFVLDQLLEWVGRRRNIMICGQTGVGKTTLLSCLAHGLSHDLRIVTVEDPAELWLPQPQVQVLEARKVPTGSNMQPLTVANCVDDAMRMNPHYLVVGEVRQGDAAQTLFRALMSDHPGMTTFHASNPARALSRLQIIMQADAGVDPKSVPELVWEALDVFVQLSWVTDEQGEATRMVTRICEPVRMEDVDNTERQAGRYIGTGESQVVFRILWDYARFPGEILAPLRGDY